jgi:hypothetical protein
LIGAGLTSCRFGEFSFSVQVVLLFIVLTFAHPAD